MGGLVGRTTSEFTPDLEHTTYPSLVQLTSLTHRFKFHLPAPKMPLPGHAESYNPPEEYLLTEQEKQLYDDMDPSERYDDLCLFSHGSVFFKHFNVFSPLLFPVFF